jgi:NADH-quinone oxidoreductase subunit E
MAEGGQTSLTEIDDTTKGDLPIAHVVDGAEKASHAFAGPSINGGGNDYDGVPTPAEDAVAKVKADYAAKSDKNAEHVAKPEPKKDTAKTAAKVEKAAKKPEAEPKPVSKAKPEGRRAEVRRQPPWPKRLRRS